MSIPSGKIEFARYLLFYAAKVNSKRFMYATTSMESGIPG